MYPAPEKVIHPNLKLASLAHPPTHQVRAARALGLRGGRGVPLNRQNHAPLRGRPPPRHRGAPVHPHARRHTPAELSAPAPQPEHAQEVPEAARAALAGGQHAAGFLLVLVLVLVFVVGVLDGGGRRGRHRPNDAHAPFCRPLRQAAAHSVGLRDEGGARQAWARVLPAQGERAGAVGGAAHAKQPGPW